MTMNRKGIGPAVAMVLLFLLSAVTVVVVTNPEIIGKYIPKDHPKTMLKAELKDDKIIIKSLGGDSLNLSEIRVFVSLNGEKKVYEPPFLYDDDGVLTVEEEFGVTVGADIEKANDIEVWVVHVPSKFTLLKQKLIVKKARAPTATPTQKATATFLLAPPNSSYLVLNKDTQTWYRTIGEAVKEAENNNTILVYPGYDVEESLSITKTLKIESLGNATIRGCIAVKAKNVEINGFRIYGCINVYSVGCTIKDCSIYASGQNYGIRGYHASNLTVDSCEVYDAHSGGISVYRGEGTTIKNTTVSSGYFGIYLSHSPGSYISENRIFNARYGIYVTNCDCTIVSNVVFECLEGIGIYHSNSYIASNRVENITYTAISVSEGDNNEIVNNHISNARFGIKIYGCNNNTVINNVVDSVTDYAIYFSHSGNNTVIGNKIFGKRYEQGIRFYRGNGSNLIERNEIVGSRYGISLAYCSNNIVRSNSLSHTTYFAIHVSSGSNQTIENNQITYARAGIYASGSDVVIRNNKLSNCSGNGIYLSRLTDSVAMDNELTNVKYGFYVVYNSHNNTIRDNVISKGDSYGIYIYRSKNCTVINNTISECYGGIEVGGSGLGGYGIATNNKIFNCIYGIKLYSSHNVISSNSIVNITDTAIGVSKGTGNVIENNTIENVKTGIYLYYSSENVVRKNVLNSGSGRGITINGGRFNEIYSNEVVGFAYVGIDVSSDNNLIYNNLFNNTKNVMVRFVNAWNVTKQIGTNILGGSYIGGNAWLKPDGSGYSQTCVDNDGDGICDEPYVINRNNIDYLPLKLD